jgi:hypothetical protein
MALRHSYTLHYGGISDSFMRAFAYSVSCLLPCSLQTAIGSVKDHQSLVLEYFLARSHSCWNRTRFRRYWNQGSTGHLATNRCTGSSNADVSLRSGPKKRRKDGQEHAGQRERDATLNLCQS